jgi:TatD DNase family protein
MNDGMISNAKKSSISLVLTAGIDVLSSEEAVKIANRFDIVKACVGIHPWRADTYSENAYETLMDLAKKNGVVAISEIGLDYVGRRTPEWEFTTEYVDPKIQKTALKEQIRIAKMLQLPIIVHDRTPTEEVLDILDEEGMLEIGAAIHGFNKSLSYARRCVKMGIYLSIGKRSLENGNEELKEIIRQIPLKSLLTETDSGDPTGVITVAEKIAGLKGITTEKAGQTATDNLKRLLNGRSILSK